jgi:hypothetical protein
VPGGGLLRDGTRWVLLVALLQAPLFGLGAARIAQAVRPRLVGLGVVTLLLLAPVALAPDLAGGLSGLLRAVGFPEEYAVARAALQDAVESRPDGGGDVLLLPYSSYRAPSWNEGRRTLDPLGRYLTPDFLQSDDLYVSGRLVPGEDRRAERVGEILAEGGSPTETAALLRAEGIAWVVLDREAEASVGDAAPSLDVPQDDVLLEGKRLAVWGLPGPVRETDDGAARVALTLAWGAAGATLVLMLAGRCTASVRRRRSRRPVRAG